MIVYFIAFFFSWLFCFAGDRRRKRDQSVKIFYILAVLVVSVLAGVRDLSIGTDIWTYGEYQFNSALRSNSIITYVLSNMDIEPGYSTLVFLISRFTRNSHWQYFIFGVITYGFILAGINKYSKYVSVNLAWLTYLFTFYGDTLNAIRQCMAVAILFYGLSFLQDEKYKKAIIYMIFALLFHNTAMVGAVIIFIHWGLNRYNGLLQRSLIVGSAIAACAMFNPLLQILIKTGILRSKFTRYIATSYAMISLNPILVRLPIFLLIVIFYYSFINNEGRNAYPLKKKSDGDFLIIMLILEMVIAEMRSIVTTLYRLSFFFGVYKAVAYSRLATIYTMKKNKEIITAILFLYLIVVWIYQNVLQGNNDIYPYTSEILGLL